MRPGFLRVPKPVIRVRLRHRVLLNSDRSRKLKRVGDAMLTGPAAHGVARREIHSSRPGRGRIVERPGAPTLASKNVLLTADASLDSEQLRSASAYPRTTTQQSPCRLMTCNKQHVEKGRNAVQYSIRQIGGGGRGNRGGRRGLFIDRFTRPTGRNWARRLQRGNEHGAPQKVNQVGVFRAAALGGPNLTRAHR